MSKSEKELISKKFQKLFDDSGTHSPSLLTIKKELPEINIKIDACFLSNPYATDLFMDRFKTDVIDTGLIREVLEFYPSQNNIISKTLSKTIDVPEDNIFIGNGATEIIQAIFHNFVERKVIINIPTFSPYYEFVREDTEVIFHQLKKEDNFCLDVESFCRRAKESGVDTAVIINPNNPDGGYIKNSDIAYICNELGDIPNLIIDESFIHFTYEDSTYDFSSSEQLVKKYDNVIIIKSMSKDFGIAGIRAGYCVMDKQKVETLLKNGYLWNVNGLTEFFFNLYSEEKFMLEYEKVRVKYIKYTNEFIKQLKAIEKIKVYPSKANFVLVELPEQIKSQTFVKDLLIDSGIYFRSCDDKKGLEGNFVRIASRDREQNDVIVREISKYFGDVDE
jgi:histidinol-phosphate/aromatic aminotransferase/cobyric acid decarboxylase-like protein